MTYINKLDSFDEVAAKYASTVPVVSKRHTKEEDIRPIGARRRKWERIIRVSPNCYVLSCGGNYDPVFHWGWADKIKDFPMTAKETARLAPIVWRKHKDGTETITIRNGQGDWQHNNVYSFLSRALPRELWFRINRQGRQAIYNRAEGKDYYLPKTKTVPRHVYEHLKDRAKQGSDWYKKHLRACMVDFDNMSLTFKRTKEGKFELVGEAPKEFVKKVRVLKDEKAKYKVAIDTVYDWAMTMYPLMRTQLNWNLRNETGKRLEDIAKEHSIKDWVPSWNALFVRANPNLIRKILTDEQHPMRYEFGIAAMFEIHDVVEPMDRHRQNGWTHADLSDEDYEKLRRSKTRAAYVKWINKMAGFAKTIKEEK